MTANLKSCPFCGEDAYIYSCARSMHDKTIYSSCHCIDGELTPEFWNHRPFEEKAVEVLAIRLGYLTDRECLTKEETIEHFEAAWKACTGENWQNFREQKRAEAKQLLGVR